MATKKATKKKIVVTQDNVDEIVLDTIQSLEESLAQPKTYLMWLKFNDQEFTIETDDIGASLLSIKPTVLKTRVLLKIIKGDKVCDKILSGMQARQVFRNKLAMTVFLNRLIFK